MNSIALPLSEQETSQRINKKKKEYTEKQLLKKIQSNIQLNDMANRQHSTQ